MYQLLVGDVREQLASLEAGSVDCVVTSPPYWGLRDYGTGTWEGGDEGCDHAKSLIPRDADDPGIRRSTLDGGKHITTVQAEGSQYRDVCGKCGARRVDKQIGLEATPEAFLETIVGVFREVRRVLAAHGTCWVNLGDSYNSIRNDNPGDGFRTWDQSAQPKGYVKGRGRNLIGGLKHKDLVGIPWRTALALQADGWYLRSDIIWAKPNPMPESVTDRPTKAHEYVFLLTKAPRYFYDADAVRENVTGNAHSRGNGLNPKAMQHADASTGIKQNASYSGAINELVSRRNLRSVWNIPTHPYPDAHFATYPPKLVERCLLAGCPRWVCRECGRPRERIVEADRQLEPGRRTLGLGEGTLAVPRPGGDNPVEGVTRLHHTVDRTTTGWTDCGHHNYRPGRVLDPFVGSGTTMVVALRNYRDAMGIELNPDYAQLARRRLERWWDDPERPSEIDPDQLTLIE